MAPLTILQWNARSIRHKKSEICHLINQHNPTVLAISETWLKQGSHFRVPGFECFRDDHVSGWDGCALLVNRFYPFTSIPIPNHSPDINIVACRVSNFTYTSVYLPRPSPLILAELESILLTLPSPLIVLGDFNCHHTMWGSASCDYNSSHLLDVFENLNLCLLNDGSPTRRTPPNQNPSSVDLSLASPNLASRLVWSVLSRSHGSDHLPILICLPSVASLTIAPSSPLLKYRLDKADWPEFVSLVSDKVNSLPPVSSDNYIELYYEFSSILSLAANSTIPLKNSSLGKIPSPPWWDSECTAAIKNRNTAEDTYTRPI